MKLRRTVEHAELCTLPLDAVDMFLLSRVDGELTFEGLADMAPCSPEETALRVAKLVKADLLQAVSQGARELEHDEGVPELEEPVLDDVGPELASDWGNGLADPSAELTWPAEAPTSESEVLFEADPPSTLVSVFRRGPTEIEIQTLPSTQPPARTREDSKVVRKPTVLEVALDDDELASKRK